MPPSALPAPSVPVPVVLNVTLLANESAGTVTSPTVIRGARDFVDIGLEQKRADHGERTVFVGMTT